MKKKLLTIAFLFCTSVYALAQNTLQYEISFPNAVHHEAEVSLVIPNVPVGPLTLRMSRSSTGRYATHEFGKNVYNVKAFDGQGKTITLNQIQGDVYQVPQHSGKVKITYTIFGNWVDGTYLAIDETHAHMNIPAVFMWAKGLDKRDIQIKFNDLNKYGWKVATQLKPTGNPAVYTAPDFQFFMDSPIELSAYKLASWDDVNPDKTRQTIHLSSHSNDAQPVIDNFGKMVQQMTAESKAVFGELPRFDYGNYTFLQDVNSENGGDGMEHRNSTVITSGRDQIAGNEKSLLGTFSHEFFHAWNVERIRPKSLEPFDFGQANMSSELWFAEGFTQYYGDLILKRAGLRDLNDYCNTLQGMTNYVLNSPAAAQYPATQMSRYAVFSDAGVAVDQNNQANIFNSYYYYGATIALGLDLRLRSEFNTTLDNYMQAVWKAHGKTEIPYTIPDLQNVLAKLTNSAFANDFFKRYVYGTDKNDYQKLLANAGLLMRKAAPESASLGTLRLMPANGKLKVAMNTIKGTPAYLAGLDNGDYLLKINEDELKTPADLNTILGKYKPGDEVLLAYEHRGMAKSAKVKLQASNALEVIPMEKAGMELSPEMQKFRESWLSSQIK
ncbi:MAG TPA: PDZ domain-containing protein [Daejeonella sp.]|nr:PDZ domain-containing protein [Daejeonella sp.]